MTAAIPASGDPSANADESGFPLDRYLQRIGYGGPREASLEVLRQLHFLHPNAIAYENLDPLIGRPVSIAEADLVAKLLSGKRGGYCYEQNGLFARALTALGFRFAGLGARVLWNQPDDRVTARSHHILLIDLPQGQYIADIGFGGMTPTAPLRLVVDEAQATPHGPMRFVRRDGDYFLQAQTLGTEGLTAWRTLYRFDLHPQQPIDYVVGNHYVSTFEASIFRTSLMAARPVVDGRLTLANNRFTAYCLDGSSAETVLETASSIRALLQESFNLTVPDVAAFDHRVIELGFVPR
ncbi:MAG TPA: arylamine N-acetyltransferase [Dongiaceae bacterium]|nr:arylamine N-acetyltransferase [Dongiaceae bacterium]